MKAKGTHRVDRFADRFKPPPPRPVACHHDQEAASGEGKPVPRFEGGDQEMLRLDVVDPSGRGFALRPSEEGKRRRREPVKHP